MAKVQEEDKKRAYGLSYAELDELRYAQNHDEVEMVPCNGNPDFEIAKHEASHVYVIRTEAPLYDENTGKKMSSPRIERFNVAAYKQQQKHRLHTLKVEILHDPTLEEGSKAKKGSPKAKADAKAKTPESKEAGKAKENKTDSTPKKGKE